MNPKENMWVPSDTCNLQENINIKGKIRNIGDAETNELNVGVLISSSSAYGGASLLLEAVPYPGLSPGDSIDLDMSVPMADSLTSGYYQLGIYVDSDSSIGEMLEDNNYSSTEVLVLGYPEVYLTYPEENSIITKTMPYLAASYRDLIIGIDTAQVRLYIDDIDISHLCTKRQRRVSYTPQSPMQSGEHTVLVEVGNSAGYLTKHSWKFTIDSGTGIESGQHPITDNFILEQNFPNPFNGQTHISIHLKRNVFANLSVYDINGNHIKTLVSGFLYKGSHKFSWDARNTTGRDISSGIYIVQFRTGETVLSRRMLYIK